MRKKKLTIEDYLRMPWHYSTEASEWEDEKGYWISVAELPDCSTFATSLEDGLKAMPSLLRQYLKAAVKSNAPIPLPEKGVEKTLTDKILLRVPVSLHMGVKNAAKRERTSINQFAVKALAEAVTKVSSPRILQSDKLYIREKPAKTYSGQAKQSKAKRSTAAQ